MVSASEDSTPSIIYHCVLRGLERLLLSEQLSRVDGEALVKLSVDRVNMPSPHRAMAALGLMLTCMYTGKEHLVTYPGCVTSMYSIRTGAFDGAGVASSIQFSLVCMDTPLPAFSKFSLRLMQH